MVAFCGGVAIFGLQTDSIYRKQFFGLITPAQQLLFNEVHGDRKKRLFQSLSGKVMELGPGGGNFAYYPKDRSIQWTGVEANPFVVDALKANAAKNGFPPAILDIHCANLEDDLKKVPSESLDAVVTTQVLCAVDNPQDVLQQVVRVLKPGGRYYFVEHTAHPEWSVMRFLQNAVDPFRRIFSNGCSLTNLPADSIHTNDGFSQVYMESWPKRRDKEDPRKGIRLVTYDAETKQLAGVSGLKPIVAGVAVKKLRSLYQDVNPFQTQSRKT